MNMWGTLFLALATGIVIGIVFQSLRIPSPAPPFMGLIGLLGMFLGQRLIPWIKLWISHK
jgi:XapX domain-containing protein